jgi:hypothetical protein
MQCGVVNVAEEEEVVHPREDPYTAPSCVAKKRPMRSTKEVGRVSARSAGRWRSLMKDCVSLQK